MKVMTIYLMSALVLITACSSDEAPRSTPAPQKKAEASPHWRLYFSFKNCELDTATYKGWNNALSFETVVPEKMEDSVAWKYIPVTIKSGDKELYRTMIDTPVYKIIVEREIPIINCAGMFFVDVPKTIPADAIKEVIFESGSELVQPTKTSVQLSALPNQDLKASELLTAEKALKDTPHRVMKFYGDSSPETAWDLVVLSDGFTAEELNIESDEGLRNSHFGRTLQIMLDSLFRYKPFSETKDKINVWVVATPSKESGADIPSQGIVKDTFYDGTMGLACIERLPGFKNGLLAYEMAAKAPYDQAMMLMNVREGTGSGGPFMVMTMGHGYSKTFVHELGHSLGKLADSYYYFSDKSNNTRCAETQYGEYITTFGHPSTDTNPDAQYEPNATLFIDNKAKWFSLLPNDYKPVFIAYPSQAPKADVQNRKVTFTTSFSKDATSVIFLTSFLGTTEYNKSLTDGLVSLTIDGVGVPKEKMRYFEKNALSSQQILLKSPADSGIFRFLEMDVTVKAKTPVTVIAEFNDSVDAKLLPQFVADAQSFTFVSHVFEPSELGLIEGSSSSLEGVFRPAYSSMMTQSGNDFSTAEERTMFHALLPYIAPVKEKQ